jgi:SpoVK/Ycf46/Vps4 family AAA+-type ATPase
MSSDQDLGLVAQLLQNTLAARPQRGRTVSADEVTGLLKTFDGAGSDGAAARIARAFGLTPPEADVLLLAAAPELDPRFRRVVGFLHDNLNRDRVTVGLAVEVLATRGVSQRAARALFHADAPLRQQQVLLLGGAGLDALSGRELVCPERVVRALLGENVLDDALIGLAQLAAPGVALTEVKAPMVPRALELLVESDAKTPAGLGDKARPIIALKGPDGSGKQHTARAMATALGRPLLVVDATLLPKDAGELLRLLRLAVREALLLGAMLYIDHADHHSDPEGPAHPHPALLTALRRYPEVFFVAGLRRIDGLGPLERDVFRILCELPTPSERARLWAAAIPAGVKVHADVDLAEISRKYSLGAGQVAAGAREAANAARVRAAAGEAPEVRTFDLLDGARGQLLHRLTSVAERVTRTYRWEDLILPEDVIEVLREMVGFAKHRSTVYEQLGFGGKHAYGRGMSGLFSGPPGTGKTMVAGIMARELDMELFRIDLSRVVSKWIGETEKNLGRVFDEAALSHAIILFDEADSLFAKRTEVKSSVDRYANLEVNYLLQRMEAYEGVSILTTNFEDTLDEAFKRRLNFRIEFPFPEIEDREKLWPIMLPKEAAREDNINWNDLARRFELSGGNIRNAVMRAAFYSVEAKAPISQDMLERAAIRESEEMGKLVHRPVSRR